MPDSGYPIEEIICRGIKETDTEPGFDTDEYTKRVEFLRASAKHAMDMRMFTEWLESFVGAWNAGADVYQAAQAGIIEWDM